MTTYTDKQKISSAPTDTPIYYPDTDGKPMAASDLHRDILNCTLETLKAHYAQRPDVYVSGDILMYYVKGVPHRVVAPDVLVSFGLDKKRRNTYLVWVEGKLPDFVMEFSSKTTYAEDLGKKMDLYASLGIQDYFLYDAEGLFLASQLMGWTLVDGVYVPVSEHADGGLHSDVLSLDFHVDDEGLGFYDPVAGAWLQTPTEAAEARAENAETLAKQEASRAENAETLAEQEAARAEQEAARAEQEAARAANAETLAEQEAARAEQEAARAEQEASRAEQEASRAEQEASRAESAETLAEQEASRAEQEAARAEQEAARAENAETLAEQEASRAEAAETEVARLREQLQRLQTHS